MAQRKNRPDVERSPRPRLTCNCCKMEREMAARRFRRSNRRVCRQQLGQVT